MARSAQKIHSKPHQLSKEVSNALVSLGLEGISLSEKSLADIYLFDAGKLSKKEVLSRVIARGTSKAK